MKKKILLIGLIYFGLVSFRPTQINLTTQIYREMVFNAVDDMEFKFKDIVKAQAILESGHFNSDVFKQNNNVFGIRLPKKEKRPLLALICVMRCMVIFVQVLKIDCYMNNDT